MLICRMASVSTDDMNSWSDEMTNFINFIFVEVKETGTKRRNAIAIRSCNCESNLIAETKTYLLRRF
jgi:hypothetical protein